MEEDEEPTDIEHRSTQNEEKKHVTVNDEPEVFTINPDSLEVEKQVKPKLLKVPSLEVFPHYVSPERLSDIIQETAEIIQKYEEKVIHQKLNNAKLGYILIRIAESIEEYEILMNRLIRFLVNGDEVTAKYFIDICQRVPPYGDYLSILYSMEDPSLEVKGIEGPVEKSDLLALVEDIHKNTYNGGISIESFRAMNKNIELHMWKRKQMSDNFTRQIKKWLKLQNNVTEQLDELREKLYGLSTYLDILKSGDTKIRFIPDTSLGFRSLRTNESTPTYVENSSFTPKFHSTPMSLGTTNDGPKMETIVSSSDNNWFRPDFHSTPVSFRNSGTNANYISDKSDMFFGNRSFRPKFHSTSMDSRMSNGRPMSGNSIKSHENSDFKPNFHSTSIPLSTWPTTEDSARFTESYSFSPAYHSSLLPTRSTSEGSDENSFRPDFHSTPMSFRKRDVKRLSEDSIIPPKSRSFRPNFHSTPVSFGLSDGINHSTDDNEVISRRRTRHASV